MPGGGAGARAEVSPNVLYRWRRELREFGSRAFSGPGRSRAEEQKVAALEIDFLRGCLQHVNGWSVKTSSTTYGRLAPTVDCSIAGLLNARLAVIVADDCNNSRRFMGICRFRQFDERASATSRVVSVFSPKTG